MKASADKCSPQVNKKMLKAHRHTDLKSKKRSNLMTKIMLNNINNINKMIKQIFAQYSFLSS